jgi:hypothetical protein
VLNLIKKVFERMRATLVALLVMQFAANTLHLNVASMLPEYVEAHY